MAKKAVVKKSTADYDGEGSVLNDIAVPHQQLVDELNKHLGDAAYIIGSGDSPADVKEWLSTGSTVLDMIISNDPEAEGGIPVGKLVEISGEAATGKSLISYMILRDCLERGGVPVLIDTESSCNFDFLRLLGLEPDKNLIYVQPDSIEDVFKTIETVIKNIREQNKDRLCCIVWDSIAATSADIELQKDTGDSLVGVHARLIGQGLRKVIRLVSKQRISLVFLNQLRTKIGVVFGDPDTTPGGRAVPFMASVRLKLYTAGKVKADNDVIGVGIRALVAKNRMGPPHRDCQLRVYFTRGLIDEESWLEILLSKGIIKKKTTQLSTVKFKGEEHQFKNTKFVAYLDARPELRLYLQEQVKKVLYVEPDPHRRTEMITLEPLAAGEDAG
jgi:recombination protein RecA|tara:strand:+ start:2373 stop:3533 length:1161 start_codon:yes stop_codon:yes gene_type:complete